ncbi:MAG: hypothetical protein ACRDHZ_16770 [Ktedonobacteraceae bacterium]
MQNTHGSFLASLFPRLLATLCVLVLIGGISLICLLGIAWGGPALSHGTHVEHAAGEIVALGPDKNFTLLTAVGKRLTFQCGPECHASLAHMQRHMSESAHTDVYYIEGPDASLMALDVD